MGRNSVKSKIHTMDDGSLPRREAARPRRVSAAAELGANVSLQDGEVIDLTSPRESQPGADRSGAAGGRMERRNSAPQVVHQRHMPKEPYKFHIPKKTEVKRGGPFCVHAGNLQNTFQDIY